MKKFFLLALLALSIKTIAQIPTDGLIGYWSFTGNMLDMSGNAYNGTNHGATLSVDRFSNSNSAYYFNGVTNYIVLNNNLPIINSPQFTISAWAKMNGLGGGTKSMNNIFEQRCDVASTNAKSTIHLTAEENTGKVSFLVRSSVNSSGTYIETTYPSKGYGTWHHYVGVLDASNTLRLYIDGVQVSQTPYTQTGNFITDINYVDIGSYHYSGDFEGYFNGIIDEVRIYNRGLTPCEIYRLYSESTLSAPTITSFAPTTGSVGTLVTVTGTNLSGLTSFTIGGVSAIVISNTGTTLVGMVMPGATTDKVSITTLCGTANSVGNFSVAPTPYPSIQQGNKIVGSGNLGNSYQGWSSSLSADGNTSIVGGYYDNNQQGAAWVFTRSGGVWSQQGNKLVGTGNLGTARQGISVALSADGNTAIVGGYYDNNSMGAAWVFTRSGGVWTQQGSKLVGSGSTGTYIRQGISVALSADGNTALVGGNSDNSNQGAVWIYSRSGGTWAQQGSKLVGTGNIGAALQGDKVSLSADGNTAIVGGYYDNNQQGAVWVYTRSAGVWTQQGSKLVGTGSIGITVHQGNSVSLSADGNIAIVGGGGDNNNQGAAWIYSRLGGIWTQQGDKLVGTGSIGSTVNQGRSVSISADGNTAIVGGYYDNGQQGAVWVYTRSGNIWTQEGSKLVGTGNNGAAMQSESIFLSADGSTAIVGGDADNNYLGEAWVFIPCNNPIISSQSTLTQTQCIGGTFTPITITATGTGLTYQWFYNTSQSNNGGQTLNATNGAQTNSYSPQSGTAGTKYYYCVVTGTCGTATSAVSGAFIVDQVSVGGSVTGTASITYGSSSGTITLESYTGTIQHWQRKLNAGTWEDVANTDATYSEYPSAAGTWYYRAVVKSGVCIETTSTNFVLTVNKAPLTVTADDKNKVYGATDPTLDYTASGTLYFSDTYSVITGVNLSTTTGAVATYGTHTITASGGTATNYNVTHVAGTLNVSKATLTVINALAHDKIYDTYTTATVSGAQLNGVLYSGTVNLGNSTTGNFAQTNVGSHIAVSTAMTISGADAFNYNLTQPNYLTADITPKDLSITADNKSKDYDGFVYSPFTVTYNGFEGGQNEGVLGGMLSFGGTASTATDVGSYTIIPSGQTSSNYAITYTNGTLTINCNTPVNVINTSNSGYGSLRNAIANVCDPGTIYFNSVLDIPLSSGLVINKNITFDNDCALTNGITIRGSGDLITINSGKTLTLSACSKITVSGTIKNNAGVSGIVISSGASFIQNTANLPATAKRILSSAWHQFGSPFQQSMGATLSNINTGVGTVQLKPYTNGTNWLANVTSAYYFLQPTVGYAVCPSTAVTASLSGNLFNGLAAPCDYSISLVYNGTAATQSWNLVANPYPSYLNWNSLGKTNISTTLYLWNPAVMGPPVTNTSYFTVYNSANGVGVPTGTKPYIAPLQGFFVRAIYTNPRITLPLSARTHSTGTFYKEADNTEILVRLKTETDMGMDEMVICRNPDAKLTYEDYDSEKMFDGLPVGMYSQAASGEKLVINTISDTNTIIPLSLIGSTGDKAKIIAFDLESSIPVYLEDRMKGKITNLSENTSYSFEFPTNEVTGRFFIRFNSSNAPLTTSNINVFASNQKLNVIAQTGEEIQEVEVFTLTGACVFKATPSSSNVFSETLNLSSAIYLVKVKTSLSTKNVKVGWE